MTSRRTHTETKAGWELVAAAKYRGELPERLALLRAGEPVLFPAELEILGPLLPACRRLVHLQCSHGLDALSLLRLGVTEVVGIDISEAMIELAREASTALRAAATWHCCDVLDAPHALDGTADLVYTGKGALPWMMDIRAWGAVVHRLLGPGGRVYVFEGHPLDALWDRDSEGLRLVDTDVSYFDRQPREAPGFPTTVVREVAEDRDRPRLLERHWRPGQVIASLVEAGLHIERFDEHPQIYWNQFPELDPEVAARLPHTYSILARKP